MNANKVIHEARGLCWHEYHGSLLVEFETIRGKFLDSACFHCGLPFQSWDAKPDYTSPVAYCELMEWMRGEDRINELEDWACDLSSGTMYIDFENWMGISRHEQVRLIAEAIQAGVLK